MPLLATKISTAASDNFRVLKGKFVSSADGDGDYIAFELPKHCYIILATAEIKTAFTALSTGTLTVGIKEPGAVIDASRLGADTVTLSEVVGSKVLAAGIYLENGGVLTLGVTKGDSVANLVARAFVVYSVIH